MHLIRDMQESNSLKDTAHNLEHYQMPETTQDNTTLGQHILDTKIFILCYQRCNSNIPPETVK